jgi:hypothetical protein
MRRFALALVAASLALGSTQATGQAVGRSATTSWSGRDCPDIQVRVPFDPRRARDLVPARFQLVQPVQGFVEALRCDALTLDGERIGKGHVALAAVSIESPEGRPPFPLSGGDYYLLWHLTDLPVLRDKTASVGIRGAVVPGISVEVGAMALARAVAEVPWLESPHIITAQRSPVRRPFSPLEFVFWHIGDQGLVRYVVQASGISSLGLGSIHARPGSELADLLGSSLAVGLGIDSRIDFDVTLPSAGPRGADD